MSTFGERFGAFAAEAQAVKDEASARIREHLEAIDGIIAELDRVGIPVRLDLPMGAHTKAADMRLITVFQARLK